MPENQQSNSGNRRKPWKIPNPEIKRMSPELRFGISGKDGDDRNGLIGLLLIFVRGLYDDKEVIFLQLLFPVQAAFCSSCDIDVS